MNEKAAKGAGWSLVIVRLVLGLVASHGAQTLFGHHGTGGFAPHTRAVLYPGPWLESLGAAAEIVGGLMVALGIACELGALILVPVLLCVCVTHAHNGFLAATNGFEYPFVMVMLAIAVAMGGPGHLYLWDPCRRWHRAAPLEGSEDETPVEA